MLGLGFTALASLCGASLLPSDGALPETPPSSGSAPDPKLLEDLVYANRILYDQGVLDGFGHVSVRHNSDPTHFLLARNMAPGLVTVNDILKHDRDGTPTDARGHRVYLERFIHAAIYRARPDVTAIVHSHSPSIIPYSVTRTSLRPVYHMSGFLGAGTPIFEIRDVAGMTDMLVRDNNVADALARTLNDKPVALMRGHGSVVVGNSIQQAVYRAIYTETSARLQAEAAKLGPIIFLSPEEAAKAAATDDSQLARPWELWKARIGKVE